MIRRVRLSYLLRNDVVNSRVLNAAFVAYKHHNDRYLLVTCTLLKNAIINPSII